jgi:uncharacterized protein (TIGR02646 family)
MERLGDYCSYCERQIETHLAVEHVQPKSHNPALKTEWRNFLLACVNCNSSKGDTDVELLDYLWPDSDNTLLAFRYHEGGLIEVNTDLSDGLQIKGQATIALTGLDKVPGHSNTQRRPSKSDRRWLKRKENWDLAVRDKKRLETNNSIEVRELIVENAIGRGMFSIWWTVFDGDQDMRRRLREAFQGTDVACFDTHEELQSRQGGQV